MKYIMLPIHSNWVCSIMNGIKKIEVRSGTRLYNAINRLIDEQGCAPCLIYCTKGEPTLLPKNRYRPWFAITPYGSFEKNTLNGKVVAEFEAEAETILNRGSIDETDTMYTKYYGGHFENYIPKETISEEQLLTRSCLIYRELDTYLRGKNGTAIHVHNLKIFDKPKELKEFKHPCKHKELDCEECVKLRIGGSLKDKPKCHYGTSIEHAPQSFMFVEVDE